MRASKAEHTPPKNSMKKSIAECIEQITGAAAAPVEEKKPDYTEWNQRKIGAACDMARVMTGEARAGILKALQKHEPIENILLQAIESIGHVSGNAQFVRQCKRELYDRYEDNERVQSLKRLEVILHAEKLKAALERTDDETERQRIQNALNAIQ